MVKINMCDIFPFTLLFWLTVRVLAENTAEFIREQDIFVNHGFRNVTTTTDIQCCVTCMLDSNCLSVSYNDANKICQVNDEDPRNNETATKTRIVGWTSFYREYIMLFFKNKYQQIRSRLSVRQTLAFELIPESVFTSNNSDVGDNKP